MDGDAFRAIAEENVEHASQGRLAGVRAGPDGAEDMSSVRA